jgi:hypothetical protein
MNAILSARDRHPGEPVAILANGPSLTDHPLNRITCATIGINQSRRFHDSRYHVALDWDHFAAPGTDRASDGSWRPQDLRHLEHLGDRLWTVGQKPYGVRLTSLNPPYPHTFAWSEDLTAGVYSHVTAVYVALQVAVWMGFTRIYLLGVDLKTRVYEDPQGRNRVEHGHCYPGHPMNPSMEPQQREVFGFAAGWLAARRPDVHVFVCNPAAMLGAFPKLRGMPADILRS